MRDMVPDGYTWIIDHKIRIRSEMMENDKVKVLVVDDEQDIRTLLNIYLKRLGYDVVEAVDGMEAVEAVRADNSIDLIVMDIMMPRLSGTEACEKIREFSSIPVLFLTAKTKEPDQNEAYDVGMVNRSNSLIRSMHFCFSLWSTRASRGLWKLCMRIYGRKNIFRHRLIQSWYTS